MKTPRLLAISLLAILAVIAILWALVLRQRPPQSDMDINRGFPQTSSASPLPPEPAVPATTFPVTPPVTLPAATSPRSPSAASRTATGSSQTLYILPDAGLNWLYTLIGRAHSTIDMTMYELVDATFSADLVAACGRGVTVRVILDQNLERAHNLPAYTQLNSAGPNCTAAWANPQFSATHEKSLVLDSAIAVIQSLNLTTRYYASSREFAIVEHDPADIAAIEATFNTDFNSNADLNYQPPSGDALIWSPTTAQPDLLSILNGAERTLLVENEEMAAPGIVAALEAACRRGVAVEIAMTDTSVAYHANYTALEAAGCGVHIGANNASTLYIHAKAIIADLGTAKQIGYVGSINFSNASLTRNRELGLYLHDAAILNQIGTTIGKDYAQFPAF